MGALVRNTWNGREASLEMDHRHKKPWRLVYKEGGSTRFASYEAMSQAGWRYFF